MVQYYRSLDTAFAAVADPTRRGILEHLGRRDASISELAGSFDMTLTGIKKHVAVLEDAARPLLEAGADYARCSSFLLPRIQVETDFHFSDSTTIRKIRREHTVEIDGFQPQN